MKTTIYLCVLLMCSCAAKRKLIETSQSSTQKLTEVETLNTQKQLTQSYSLGADSTNQTNFLKLYPKGEFVINKDGFLGSADSLFWYSNAQQISKHLQLEQQNKEQSKNEVHKQIQKQMVKEEKKTLAKISSSFWWFIGGGIALLVVILYYRRIRMV